MLSSRDLKTSFYTLFYFSLFHLFSWQPSLMYFPPVSVLGTLLEHPYM